MPTATRLDRLGWPSPLSLEERRAGRFAVRQRLIACDEVTTIRESFMTGKAALRATYDPPRLVTELLEGADVWMSDRACEVRQATEAIDKVWPCGRVFVGGLGLGVLASLLAAREAVSRVDVVEIAHDVISLCAPAHPKIHVWQGDVRDHVARHPWPYDFSFFDTWRGMNEGEWWSEVFPLKRALQRRQGRVRAWWWAADVMEAQVMRTIEFGNASWREKGAALGAPIPKGRHWLYKGLPEEMTKREARAFVRDPGLPSWEKKYGAAVDANLAQRGGAK